MVLRDREKGQFNRRESESDVQCGWHLLPMILMAVIALAVMVVDEYLARL